MVIKNFLNTKGHKNPISGSKVTVILVSKFAHQSAQGSPETDMLSDQKLQPKFGHITLTKRVPAYSNLV